MVRLRSLGRVASRSSTESLVHSSWAQTAWAPSSRRFALARRFGDLFLKCSPVPLSMRRVYLAFGSISSTVQPAGSTAPSRSVSRRQAGASGLASELSLDDVLKYLGVERQAGDDLLHRPIPFLELAQPLHLGRRQPSVLLPPVEERRLADARLPADLSHRPRAVPSFACFRMNAGLARPKTSIASSIRAARAVHKPSSKCWRARSGSRISLIILRCTWTDLPRKRGGTERRRKMRNDKC